MKKCHRDRVRWVSKPTQQDLELVEAWIRAELVNYEDDFDMAIDCAHDLGIFDWDEKAVDPRQDRAIPQWIIDLCERAFVRAHPSKGSMPS